MNASIELKLDALTIPVGRLVGWSPFWAAAYAFTHMGNFLLLLRTPPLRSQSRGPNSSLEAQIPVLRPKSQP